MKAEVIGGVSLLTLAAVGFVAGWFAKDFPTASRYANGVWFSVFVVMATVYTDRIWRLTKAIIPGPFK